MKPQTIAGCDLADAVTRERDALLKLQRAFAEFVASPHTRNEDRLLIAMEDYHDASEASAPVGGERRSR